MRRSSASGEDSESEDCRCVYVRGDSAVVFAARVSKVRSLSLCSWAGDRDGRFDDDAAAVSRQSGEEMDKSERKQTLVFGPSTPSE